MRGEIVWDPFFGRNVGFSYLRDLQESTPGVLINRDSDRRMLYLWGPSRERRAVRETLLLKVDLLRRQKLHTFPLDGRLVGLFMSADLIKLQEELGHGNVVFDLPNRTLKIRGDEDAVKVARLALLRAKQRHAGERKRRQSACPVCFDDVTSPVTLRCGHTWCKQCLCNYMLASIDNRLFPLKCLGDEARCTHAISLDVAQEVLSPNQFDKVVNASFLSYIHARPTEFYYCPTPDCPQIYRSAPKDTVLQCPSCLVRICPHCHVEYHDGSSCIDREKEDNKLFDEWAKNHDVKNCPKCKAHIERVAGCNHMTCAQCRTHICWVCLSTFNTSEEVYDHLHCQHGGIGI